MDFAEEFENISRMEARNALAKSIYNEVHDWRGTKKRIASRRWLWELLQNARDCSIGKEFSFEIIWRPNELVVLHDAGPFELREVVALVEGDSSKQRRSLETTGKFGKGFLVTHVVSTEVRIRGVLRGPQDDLFTFTFLLTRGGSEGEIKENIRNCAGALNAATPFDGERPVTKFIYSLSPKDESRFLIQEALRELKQHSLYLFAFIPELKTVAFHVEGQPDSTFRALSREAVPPLRTQAKGERISVETPDGIRQVITFVPLTKSDPERNRPAAQVALKVTKGAERMELATPINSPVARVFQDFPLHGTNDLEIPVVINLPRTADVDSARSEPNLADPQTRQSVVDALGLLPSLVEWAEEQGLAGIHFLGELGISKELEKDEDKQNQWRDITRPVLNQLLTCKIVEISSQEFVRAGEAVFPDSRWLDSVEGDAFLLHGTRDLLQIRGEKVPTSTSVEDWETIISKWKSIEPSLTLRIVSLKDLFLEMEKSRTLSTLSRTRKTLNSVSAALTYVCQVFRVATEYCGRHRVPALIDIQEAAVIVNQLGEFHLPRDLRLDGGIDEKLKALSTELGIPFERKLVHMALAASAGRRLVAQLCGERVMSARDAVAELINNIERRVSEPLRGEEAQKAKTAAVLLMVWLTAHKNKDVAAEFDLTPFPLLCVDGGLHALSQIHEPLILPRQLLTADETEWIELFPESVRLSDEYLSACTSLAVELVSFASFLCERKIAEPSLLLKRETEIGSDLIASLLPPMAPRSGHKVGRLEATDVTGLTRLLSETAGIVSSSGTPAQAAKVLEFVLRYLVPRDMSWKTSVNVPCLIKQQHHCTGIVSLYPCEWLAKLKTNRWVPSEESGTSCEPLTARNLGILLVNLPVEVYKSPGAREFLALHCGANPLELAIRAAAGGDPERESVLRSQWATIIETVQPSVIQEIVARQEFITKINERNRKIGRVIEDLAKEAFKNAGFLVEPTGIGSDFRAAMIHGADPLLEEQDVGVLRIKPTYHGKSIEFLVEVKATREDAVRMSWLQADTAAKKADGYILCVVDFAANLEQLELVLKEVEPSPELIRDYLKIVPGIGASLTMLVRSLSSAVETSSPGIEVEKAQDLRFRIMRSVWVGGHTLEEWAQSVRDKLAQN